MTYREMEGWQMMVFAFGGGMFSCTLWVLHWMGTPRTDLGLLALYGFPVFQVLIWIVGWLIKREGRHDAQKELVKKALSLLPSDRDNP